MDQEFTSAAQEPSRTERWMESCEEEQGWRLLPPVLCTTARSSAVSVCPCLAASSAGSRVWSCWSIPRAVLCVLPEPCFDKGVHSQPAQLGSLTLSPAGTGWCCRAALPREELCTPGTATERWGHLTAPKGGFRRAGKGLGVVGHEGMALS